MTDDGSTDANHEDRRTSVRRETTLPFTWRLTTEGVSLTEICRALGLPPALALQARLDELDQDFRRVCATLSDVRAAEALHLLDRRLSLLEEMLLGQAPHPPARALTVSADGIGFTEPDPVKVGGWLAMHLVLPVSYHLVCGARVSHCEPMDGGLFRIGAELEDLGPAAGRRLTRYAIGRD